MYGLDSTVDVTFLAGSERTQICFGQYEVILHFELSISVTLECEIAVGTAESLTENRLGGAPAQAAALAATLGEKVTRAERRGGGDLVPYLSSGATLVLCDSNADCESYSIVTPSAHVVV